MNERVKPADVDAYLATIADGPRAVLEELRSVLREALPDATECIAYQMPALRLRKVFFYYAAFKKHVGVYPPLTSDAALIAELAPYRGPKGNLQFPLDRPMPHALVARVAKALAAQYGG